MQKNSVENITIIGSGPAGLAAALYNARANLSPLIIGGSPPGGQLMLTSEVENYPGFESILGPNLIEKYREHVKKFGTRIIDENVVQVDFSGTPFEIKTARASYQAKAVIIATGAKALWLGLANETRLRGKGVSACATCDGFFFKEKILAVVGGGDTACEEALTLTNFASKVYIIHRRDSLRASKIMADRVQNHPKIEIIWNTVVTDVLGENRVEGIKMQGKEQRELKVDGLFLAIGHKPDTDLFKGQIELDRKGYVVTSAMAALVRLNLEKFNLAYQTMTSTPGVFAAGDCVDHVYRQAGTAVGLGIAAALDAERWLETTS